ncbi:MAG TPA: rhamnogalacturonan acetylesterase [Acidobacteriaceae bacterium]
MRALPISLLAAALAASAQSPAPPASAPVPAALTGAKVYDCAASRKNATALTPTTLITDTAAGWDLHSVPTIAKGVCSSDKPFYFSIPVPEGNYRITVTLGGAAASVTTVRAEARRLMLEKLPTGAGKTVTRSFDVNVRVPEFTKPDGTAGRVHLKPREVGNLDWDPKLTLEFNGTNPAVRSISIEPIPTSGPKAEPTIYLAGDSTMVDQDVEPWASWGQMLPRFFQPGIVVANHAESGESAISFVGEQRFPKILSLIKPGDYFIVQFAHNDQKVPNGLPRYTQIMTDFVTQVKAKGATPIIVTSMNRDSFDAEGHINDTLGGYPQASRKIAADTGVTLIDLNAMSKTMFEAMGVEGANHAFMKFKAGSYPGVDKDISDTTHFNNYGAYELARCIVQGIRDAKLPIAKFLDPAIPTFDPAKFDPFPTFSLPYTPMQKQEDTTKVPQT